MAAARGVKSPYIRDLLILTGSALVAPGSAFVGNPVPNPPVSRFVLTAFLGFALTAGIAAVLRIWTSDARVVPLLALSWVLFSTMGVWAESLSSAKRLEFLALIILCAMLCARIFRTGFVRWTTLTAGLSIL
ncbi:MAG TPA: hypothetical protein VJ935_00110, partial [Acidimicrobiia bacterium]|nr:hypothetical protein [Acidimicrobiia bacterium]